MLLAAVALGLIVDSLEDEGREMAAAAADEVLSTAAAAAAAPMTK